MKITYKTVSPASIKIDMYSDKLEKVFRLDIHSMENMEDCEPACVPSISSTTVVGDKPGHSH
jgi:hypothetical protein